MLQFFLIGPWANASLGHDDIVQIILSAEYSELQESKYINIVSYSSFTCSAIPCQINNRLSTS